MKPVYAKTLASYSQGLFFGKEDVLITSVTSDSRKAEKGSLFACMKGERVDGHDYAAKAVENGASCLLCERRMEELDVPQIVADSTLGAMQKMAQHMLKDAGIPVVSVGGSVGKTSTKEMISSVLSRKYDLLKTAANFNNELGLPLTIFNLEEHHNAAVLELGIDDFGQMHVLADIARPDICVLTNIGDCHLEQLKDRDGVLKAKSEMFDFLEPDGHIVLNGDDEKLRTVKPVNGVKPLFYGLSENNDFRAYDIEKTGFGSIFRIRGPFGTIRTQVFQPGIHMVMNALAGAAVGYLLGLDNDQIAKGIEQYSTIDGRFKVIPTDRYTLIDDCYNANPMSMKAAISSLSDMNGRKVAILGDMGELGTDEKKLHYEVGECAGSADIDALYCAGALSSEIVSGARSADKTGKDIRHFATRDDLIDALPGLLHDKDIILIKASHFMQFEKILDFLKQ